MRGRPGISSELATLLIESDSFRMKPVVDRPVPFKRFRTQEQIVYHVDWFVDHLLDHNVAQFWTMGTSRFVKKQKKLMQLLADEESHWQLLSDRCYGASTLLQAREVSKADATLDLLLDDIGKKAKLEDPYLMFKIWRISRMLRGIEARHPRHRRVWDDFLRALQNAALRLEKEDHPLSHLADLLAKVKAEDFRDTLRLGSYKTITSLTRNVGNNNPVVLNMWTVHYNLWDKGRFDSQLLWRLEKLCADTVGNHNHPKHLWCLPAHQLETKHIADTPAAYGKEVRKFEGFLERPVVATIPEWCVPICFYYTYAYQYFGKHRALADYLAMNLLDSTKGLLAEGENARWSLASQAYAFAARLVAKMWRKEQLTAQSTEDKKMAGEMAHRSLDEVIRRLEFGDRECQTRAVMLSDLSGRWLRKWNPKGAADERERHQRIVARLEASL